MRSKIMLAKMDSTEKRSFKSKGLFQDQVA